MLKATYYDPYEIFGQKKATDNFVFLEKKILETLECKALPDYRVQWTAHYTHHQKASAFGECALYADVYRQLLLTGKNPTECKREEVLSQVEVLKAQLRADPERKDYFQRYDRFFDFLFASGLDQLILAEIAAEKAKLASQTLEP